MIDKDKIFTVSGNDFDSFALELFRYQSSEVPVYRDFITKLNVVPGKVKQIADIPFLPVGFFKTHRVLTDGWMEQVVFTSSGTTGAHSRHYVADVSLYEKSFFNGFEYHYGKAEDYCLLALLPSYLERSGSSLIYMSEKLIVASKDPDSGFYLDNTSELIEVLQRKNDSKIPTILLGVTFALTDLAHKYPCRLENIIFMETGGMKGRGKEMVREEFHSLLRESFSINEVHSEYGMTELLSQAYSRSSGVFYCPPWMKVLARDIYDPFTHLSPGKTGSLNIIDLANVHSCSFIATSDLGKLREDGGFEVLGRMDYSDIRGCNLLVV